jgi:glycosyltransferase involved in cell wall biosynthesis
MISILIVVPTLNSYRLLPRLVQSLKTQSFISWRVLFVDGNSSREHKDWLVQQCNSDQRFHWEDEVNPGRGIFAAMNQGFMRARKDDWVLFWGSDDIVADPEIFERVSDTISAMNKEPDLYICSARYYSMDHLLKHGSLELNRCSRFK